MILISSIKLHSTSLQVSPKIAVARNLRSNSALTRSIIHSKCQQELFRAQDQRDEILSLSVKAKSDRRNYPNSRRAASDFQSAPGLAFPGGRGAAVRKLARENGGALSAESRRVQMRAWKRDTRARVWARNAGTVRGRFPSLSARDDNFPSERRGPRWHARGCIDGCCELGEM